MNTKTAASLLKQAAHICFDIAPILDNNFDYYSEEIKANFVSEDIEELNNLLSIIWQIPRRRSHIRKIKIKAGKETYLARKRINF